MPVARLDIDIGATFVAALLLGAKGIATRNKDATN